MNLKTPLSSDNPAPVPDQPYRQLEGLALPLSSLPLHPWRRTVLLPSQCWKVKLMTRPLEIFFCNWADLTRVDNNRPNWQQPVFVIPGSAIRAIGGIQHSPLFLEGNSSSFQAFVDESWVYMERNWSKQVGPCNNRPFDEQTFKTISHLTRRLTVPVVSIAPFCQVLQILFHPLFVSHHLFFSGAGPAQGTFITTQLLLLLSLHFVKGNVWGSIWQDLISGFRLQQLCSTLQRLFLLSSIFTPSQLRTGESC